MRCLKKARLPHTMYSMDRHENAAQRALATLRLPQYLITQKIC